MALVTIVTFPTTQMALVTTSANLLFSPTPFVQLVKFVAEGFNPGVLP